jgi:hypothetical protein
VRIGAEPDCRRGNRLKKEALLPDTYAIVRQAIIAKQQIVAMYAGHPREMCPHVIGTKKGRRQALFFQFGGSSSSGLPSGGEWRCIPIDGLGDVSARTGHWHTGASHTRPQSCVDAVDVEVSY